MVSPSYQEWIESIIKKKKAEFKDALLSAYNKSTIEMLLALDLNINLRTIVDLDKDDNLVFFDLINVFERQGNLIQLLEKAFQNQPNNPKLKEIYNSIIDPTDPFIPPSIDLTSEVIRAIGDSLLQGNLIFFLGSGINYTYDKHTENLPPSDIEIANHLGICFEDFKKIIGLPCQVCPADLEKRPNSLNSENVCPIWQEIKEKENSVNQYQQLKHEQNLAFAKLKMHCLSQCHLNMTDDGGLKKNLGAFFRDKYEHHQPNKVQNILADLAEKIVKENNFSKFFILTTTYDAGLEKAFEEKLDFDVVYYFIEPSNFTGNFWHKFYCCNGSQNNERGEPVTTEYQLPKTPIIFKLYGGILYKAKEEYDSFAIAESHFMNYLQRPNDNFPDNLKRNLENSNILFLGCNPNDAEIFAILHRFFPEKFSSTKKNKPKGWLISPLEPGNIYNTQLTWNKMGITLLHQCSADDLLNELQKYVETNFSE